MASFRGTQQREAPASPTKRSGDPAAGDIATGGTVAGVTAVETLTATEGGADAKADGPKAGVGSTRDDETTAGPTVVKESEQAEALQAAQQKDAGKEEEQGKVGRKGEGRAGASPGGERKGAAKPETDISGGRKQGQAEADGSTTKAAGAATAEDEKSEGGSVNGVVRTQAASKIQVRPVLR